MINLKEKFLAKVENNGTKKSIENLIVFVIILIITIIFINYIWNGDKSNKLNKEETQNITNSVGLDADNNTSNEGSLENELEKILKNLEGVKDAQVLITYEETSKVIPMYNEDSQQSVTQEEDNQGRCQDNK